MMTFKFLSKAKNSSKPTISQLAVPQESSFVLKRTKAKKAYKKEKDDIKAATVEQLKLLTLFISHVFLFFF